MIPFLKGGWVKLSPGGCHFSETSLKIIYVCVSMRVWPPNIFQSLCMCVHMHAGVIVSPHMTQYLCAC